LIILSSSISCNCSDDATHHFYSISNLRWVLLHERGINVMVSFSNSISLALVTETSCGYKLTLAQMHSRCLMK
ncbi:unnamed protein product, partial [Prunus brigantina]